MTRSDLDPPRPTAVPFVSGETVRATLGFGEAVDALANGLAARAGQPLDAAPRRVVDVSTADDGERELLLMPAHGPEGAGTKLVTIARRNPDAALPLIQGLYVLFSRGDLAPELVIDGAALTGLRTAALSALVTRQLARPESRRLVVFGAGVQGAAHVDAMRAVLGIEEVVIVACSTDSPRAVALVRRLGAEGLDASIGGAGAVARADVVCTCTTASDPVFSECDLAVGAHVNAIGAYRRTMCELPGEVLSRSLLVVETERTALAEAGDIVRAIADGLLPPAGFAHELDTVISGDVQRTDATQTTVFKSVGLSVADLILARALADRLAGDGAATCAPA